MQLNVHFFMLNEHFSQEHADAQHNGEESENNLKYEWEDELSIKHPVKSVNPIRKGTYTIQGMLGDNKSFAYDIPNTLVFEIKGEDDSITQLACSESIVDRFELIENEQVNVLNVYLLESEPHTNPIPGVYIALQEFPKELSE